MTKTDSGRTLKEIVYCKDCIYYGTINCQIEVSLYGLGDYDYCSYGRRDDE